jgi:hypothetical protein
MIFKRKQNSSSASLVEQGAQCFTLCSHLLNTSGPPPFGVERVVEVLALQLLVDVVVALEVACKQLRGETQNPYHHLNSSRN